MIQGDDCRSVNAVGEIYCILLGMLPAALDRISQNFLMLVESFPEFGVWNLGF